MGKGRYISLLGDPIGPDGKPERLRASFYKAADFKAAGVGVALAGVFSAASNPGTAVALTVAIACANLFLTMFFRVFERQALMLDAFSSEDMKGKCIDTRPDEKTVPTLERYGEKARKARLIGSIPLMSSVLVSTLHGFGVMAVSECAPGFGRGYSSYRRFDRVAKGEWVIVDMPKPKPVEERSPAFFHAGLTA